MLARFCANVSFSFTGLSSVSFALLLVCCNTLHRLLLNFDALLFNGLFCCYLYSAAFFGDVYVLFFVVILLFALFVLMPFCSIGLPTVFVAEKVSLLDSSQKVYA